MVRNSFRLFPSISVYFRYEPASPISFGNYLEPLPYGRYFLRKLCSAPLRFKVRFKKVLFVLFEPFEREPASPIFLRKIIFSLRFKVRFKKVFFVLFEPFEPLCLIKKYTVLVLRFFAYFSGQKMSGLDFCLISLRFFCTLLL